jgi:hypothetical protein
MKQLVEKLFYKLAGLAALTWPLGTQAQPTPADTTALATIVTAHQRTAATTARLYSGTEYLDYTPGNTIGNQFFMSNIAQLGSLTYDGRFFRRVPLLYDLKLDQLILFDSARNVKIRLINERVGSFMLDGRRFMRLVPSPSTSLPAGFYNVLLDGRIQLLARRTKKVVEEIVRQQLSFSYKETEQIFIHKENQFMEITTLKSLLNALPEQKAELQKFARSSKLKFTTEARELSAVLLVSHYYTLAP